MVMRIDGRDFVDGDVVRLKTGGPDMTVRAVALSAAEGKLVVRCTWFERADEPGKEWNGPFNAEFPAAMLVPGEA